MFSKLCILGLAALLAASSVKSTDQVPEVVAKALAGLVPGVQATISPSKWQGFYESVANGRIFYVSADGKYLIDGTVFDTATHENLTAERVAVATKSVLAGISADDEIVFPAIGARKHIVTVFTDVDCPFCRQFHQDIRRYNSLGIEVRYAFFPLAMHPGAEQKAVSVWCSSDRNAVYTAAMAGVPPADRTCDNPVKKTLAAGNRVGVRGTPAIYAEDGTQVGGFVPPEQLAKRLDAMSHANTH